MSSSTFFSTASNLRQSLAPAMQKVDEQLIAMGQSLIPLIPEMSAHIMAAGGKRLRPLLTLACAEIFNYSGKEHIILAACVECMHTATLLHDDVVDDGISRRGIETANYRWGNKSSILVGDFLLGQAFAHMVLPGSLEVLRVLSNAAKIISEGEIEQLVLQQNKNWPSVAEYKSVITAKTAILFAAACEVGGIIALQDAKICASLHEYGLHLGIAFQIMDDILDIIAEEEILGKPPGNDLFDGKLTLPMIYAYEEADTGTKEKWRNLLENINIANDMRLQKLRLLLKSSEGLEKAQRDAISHAKKSYESLDFLPDSWLKKQLQDLARYASERHF
jgi:octaprenyl-diphosphate synthase